MGAFKKDETQQRRKRPPATTPEGRENQMISLAIDLAEKQLIEGTASSQVISHYLKLGSTTQRYEKELLKQQVELAKAKIKAIQSGERVEELYKNALNAMRSYGGGGSRNEEDD